MNLTFATNQMWNVVNPLKHETALVTLYQFPRFIMYQTVSHFPDPHLISRLLSVVTHSLKFVSINAGLLIYMTSSLSPIVFVSSSPERSALVQYIRVNLAPNFLHQSHKLCAVHSSSVMSHCWQTVIKIRLSECFPTETKCVTADITFRRLRQWRTETIHVIAAVAVVTEQQLILQQANISRWWTSLEWNILIIITSTCTCLAPAAHIALWTLIPDKRHQHLCRTPKKLESHHSRFHRPLCYLFSFSGGHS